MTTFRLDATPGPGTHVFIVGVGKYPYLKDGAMPIADHRNLGQLTSPPVSAMAMLEWTDKTLHNPDTPLKSIEVLVSQDVAASFSDSLGTTCQVDEATWDNFEQAALAWYTRLDTDPGNIGIFYFCGHGVGDGINTHMLMSDTGKSPVFLRQALHVPAFRLAVGQCAAQKQIFFIDCCRTLDLATVLDPHFNGQSGLPAKITRLPSGANPVLYSARQGEPAFGKPGQVSDFSAALLDGLNRCGVFRKKGTSWVVQPQELQKAVAALMDDFSGKPQCPADGMSGLGFPLHVLQSDPEVVVHVSLDNPAASDAATITCASNGSIVSRKTTDHPWRTFLPTGLWNVEATFTPAGKYRANPVSLHLFPPFQDIELEVT